MPTVERQLTEEWLKFPADSNGLPRCTAYQLAKAMIARMEREGSPGTVVDIFRRKFWDQYGTPKG